MEDAAGDVDERNDKDQFERVDDVVGQLRCSQVQPEDGSCGEADDGGAAEDGIDADEKADGDAPGQLLWRGSHPKQCEDRKSNAAIGPVVMGGACAVHGLLRVRSTWLHC